MGNIYREYLKNYQGEPPTLKDLYDDLMKQADNKEMLPEKEIFSNVLTGSHIVCYYDDFSEEIGQVRASGIPYTNIRKMI